MRAQAGYLISKIHQLSGRIFAKLLKDAGISDIDPAQGRILFALWKKDNVPITELARETLLHKSTLTKMLDRLEESEHLKRKQMPGDRRTILVELTEKNRRLKEKYDEVSDEMGRIYYRGCSAEEVTRLNQLLTRVLDNLVEYAERK